MEVPSGARCLVRSLARLRRQSSLTPALNGATRHRRHLCATTTSSSRNYDFLLPAAQRDVSVKDKFFCTNASSCRNRVKDELSQQQQETAPSDESASPSGVPAESAPGTPAVKPFEATYEESSIGDFSAAN